MNLYRKNLLDRPSVIDTDHCVICGRPAHDAHHVIQKGMGGVSRQTDKRIPRLKLCGAGNTSGCHGLLHQGKLHINWDTSMGGWVFMRTPEPMNDIECWEQYADEYLPVPGWEEQQRPTHIFGSGKVIK